MSQNKLPRRNFLTRLSLGAASLITLPRLAWSKESLPEVQPPPHPVKSVHPLGFQWETADPFLFCAHHEDFFPKGNSNMGPVVSVSNRPLGDDFIIKDGFRMYHGKVVPGFPGHPHRGFETITIVRKGMVDHADSLGAAGRYGDGDVQWMTAGSGVQHSEMFPLLKENEDNPLELFQVWLNLPRKNKMTDPHFAMFWSENIPHYNHCDGNQLNTLVEVIAGEVAGYRAPSPPPNSWAADPENHVAVWNIKMDAGAKWEMPAAASGVNRTLYYYSGEGLNIAGKNIPRYHRVAVEADQQLTLQNGSQEAGILVLQGKPIGEPVIQYGPFVMNSKAEIQQAFDDYHRTRFGGWPWPRTDQVHDRSKGRFAQHADGLLEVRG